MEMSELATLFSAAVLTVQCDSQAQIKCCSAQNQWQRQQQQQQALRLLMATLIRSEQTRSIGFRSIKTTASATSAAERKVFAVNKKNFRALPKMLLLFFLQPVCTAGKVRKKCAHRALWTARVPASHRHIRALLPTLASRQENSTAASMRPRCRKSQINHRQQKKKTKRRQEKLKKKKK